MRARILFIFLGFSLVSRSGYSDSGGQAALPDSTKVQEGAKKGNGKELILEDIEIKGRVEKPGVIIVPKRISPEIKEVEINRSFEAEMKNGVGDVPQPEKALRRLEPVENIKKAVEKERK